MRGWSRARVRRGRSQSEHRGGSVNVEGKVALVTGGASGLGGATIKALHDAGASVVIVDLPSSNGEVVAKELGDRALFAGADVTSEDDVKAAVHSASERFGGLHIV